jgi:ATP-dependent helicase/nuclease subunit B
MRAILGPFHPSLEETVVGELVCRKQSDSLRPLLIVIPSDGLRRRLKILLSRERRLTLVNVQLQTFHQLALRLTAERSGTVPETHGDLFFEEILRQIVRRRMPGTAPFAGIEARAGGCAALWQSLRDLRDGLVDSSVVLEALKEGHFSRRASQRTLELLVLLQTLRNFCDDKNILDQSDLARRATELAPSSSWLKQFGEIFYYGFYDLTQVQLDFFHAVARHYPTTLFFPLLSTQPSHDAWRFAQGFYERYLQGYATESVPAAIARGRLPVPRLFDNATGRKDWDFPKNWHCRIVSAFGIRDEVTAAAKEIIRLVEERRMAFHEIGIVARTVETHGRIIKEVFHNHAIPVAGSFEQPLVEFPLVKAVVTLLTLSAKDFLRSQVIDLLSSPYFRFHNSAAEPRPDLWDLATRELAISKGPGQWRRLRQYAARGLVLRQISDDEEPRQIRISASQLASLADIVETLVGDLTQLPLQASWQDYTAASTALLEKYLGIEPASRAGEPAAIHETIRHILTQIAALDAVNDTVTIAEFSHTFQYWLERSAVTVDCRNRDGVMVLNAAAARGLKFRALFIVGLNEGLFPRIIREDAFLRDDDREVIERDLGFKVSPKLSGFDEEKLLFTLLVGAAEERLYCSFQRADEEGRTLAPSWYIEELKRALSADGRHIEVVNIARGVVEKSGTAPFDRTDYLLPGELAVKLALSGEDPAALVSAAQQLPAVYEQGRRALAELERSTERLHAYDGMIGHLEKYWTNLSASGIAPTALETYARCPFQFFARHVLGLEPLDRPEEVLGPSPAEYGQLGHEILNLFYRALVESGYFKNPSASVSVQNILEAVAARAFAAHEKAYAVGYALVWESVKDSLLQLLRQVVDEDLRKLKTSGFVPIGLEKGASCHFPSDWPAPLMGLSIRGRMDRIDRSGNRLRVIDYKFKLGAGPSVEDKNLVRAALRGHRLQPPFYDLMARSWAGQEPTGPDPVNIEADFYYIAPRWPGGPLVTASYEAAGLVAGTAKAIKETIANLADGVRQGHFFIYRGEHCAHCEALPICRKNHPPSLWRAENDPITKQHRELREKI